jgi:hypothetical protein
MYNSGLIIFYDDHSYTEIDAYIDPTEIWQDNVVGIGRFAFDKDDRILTTYGLVHSDLWTQIITGKIELVAFFDMEISMSNLSVLSHVGMMNDGSLLVGWFADYF